MVRLALISILMLVGFEAPAATDSGGTSSVCSVTVPQNDVCRSGWSGGTHFVIRARSSRKETRVEWSYEFSDNRDMRLDINFADGARRETGTIFLIGNRTMLTNGFALPPGTEIEWLGTPVLTLQLVVDLLARLIPEGPSVVAGKRLVQHKEPAAPLRIAQETGGVIIAAPWRLTGMVERHTPAKLSFELSLIFKPMMDEADEHALHFAGIWEKRSSQQQMSNATRIDGWAIHRLTRIESHDSVSPLFRLKADPAELSFPTLGALRKHFQQVR